MARVCSQCKRTVAQYNLGNLCFSCEEKRLDKKFAAGEDKVDAEGYAYILDLDSPESVKRLARDGKLAPRIPAIKPWRWRRKDIEAWFKQMQEAEIQAQNQARKQAGNRVFRRVARGIASNLRRCYKDPVIYSAPSDKIGNKVYGLDPVLGTSATGQGELISLVIVPKSTALKVLQQLPRKAFPELIGITDWGDLTYGRISEDLIVRLEAHF